MSIVNEVKPEGVKTARALIEETDLSKGLAVDSVDLMARDGTAFGGVWKRLERFQLSGG